MNNNNNIETIIEKENAELTAKGITSIKLSKSNESEDMINLNINHIGEVPSHLISIIKDILTKYDGVTFYFKNRFWL